MATHSTAGPILTLAMRVANMRRTALFRATMRERILARRAVARGWGSVARVDLHVVRSRVSTRVGWLRVAEGWVNLRQHIGGEAL